MEISILAMRSAHYADQRATEMYTLESMYTVSINLAVHCMHLTVDAR